jgi:hypothetical protein
MPNLYITFLKAILFFKIDDRIDNNRETTGKHENSHCVGPWKTNQGDK